MYNKYIYTCVLKFCSLMPCFESQKKTFTFTVHDSLVNICPLRDFAYGLRSNADPDASGLSKQSNYELVRSMDSVLPCSILSSQLHSRTWLLISRIVRMNFEAI